MQNLHCRYDFKTFKSLTSVKSTLAKATRTSDDPHSDDPDPDDPDPDDLDHPTALRSEFNAINSTINT